MGLNKDENFNEAGYVKVNVRIAEFRAAHPEGMISTFRIDTPKGVSFKAIICRDKNDAQEYALTGIAPATGHSFLPYSLMADKVEEYTETVAIGRALANFGIQVEKAIASAEEMDRYNDNKGKVQAESDDDVGEPKELPKLKTSAKFKMPKKEEKENGESNKEVQES